MSVTLALEIQTHQFPHCIQFFIHVDVVARGRCHIEQHRPQTSELGIVDMVTQEALEGPLEGGAPALVIITRCLVAPFTRPCLHVNHEDLQAIFTSEGNRELLGEAPQRTWAASAATAAPG